MLDPEKIEKYVTMRDISSLKNYEKNARTHSEEQIKHIAASIVEFGWTNPVLIDSDGVIIAGHGRVAAANKLGIATVPCIELSYLTESQKRALVIADNQLALEAGWDMDMLKDELKELEADGFDIALTGFSQEELDNLLKDEPQGDEKNSEADPYTKKITAPNYEPKNEKPELSDLLDLEKTEKLIAEIKRSSVTKEEKEFLIEAATRHIVFNYQRIADYYSHASEEMQDLMEKSSLVIIDFQKAIEYGYVKLSEKLAKQYADEEDGE